MVGRAGDANATLAALKSSAARRQICSDGEHDDTAAAQLWRDMRNNWEIIGQFMYPAGAYRSLLGTWSERNCSISSRFACCSFRSRHCQQRWMQQPMLQTLNVSLLNRKGNRRKRVCRPVRPRCGGD